MLPNPYESLVRDSAQAVDSVIDQVCDFQSDITFDFKPYGNTVTVDLRPRHVVDCAYLYSLARIIPHSDFKVYNDPDSHYAVIKLETKDVTVKWWVMAEVRDQFNYYLRQIENTEVADPTAMALYNAVRDVTGEVPF